MKKKIFSIGLIVFIIIVCITIYVFNKAVLNNEIKDINIIESSVEIKTTKTKPTRENNRYIFAGYFDYLQTGYWIWSEEEALDYLTDNFKHKYSNYFDIYPELQNKKGGISDVDSLNDKEDKIRVEFTWKDENGKEKMSRVDYELTLTDDEKIDDFKIINVKYYDPITYNPLDGSPITLDKDLAAEYIQVLWRPFYYEDHPDSPSYYRKLIANIPISENCQIINLPKEPLECEGSFPYFKAIYGKNKLSDKLEIIGMDISSINFYKVEYDLNDKAQFTRIEFIDITEDEYNEGRKR